MTRERDDQNHYEEMPPELRGSIQMTIRDVFGRVLNNQLYPNLPSTLVSLVTFLDVWEAPLGQIRLMRRTDDGPEVTIFKLEPPEENGTLILSSRKGDRIVLPALVNDDEEDGPMDGPRGPEEFGGGFPPDDGLIS